jgi:hypothetical protein
VWKQEARSLPTERQEEEKIKKGEIPITQPFRETQQTTACQSANLEQSGEHLSYE